jgi:hypothetical protein
MSNKSGQNAKCNFVETGFVIHTVSVAARYSVMNSVTPNNNLFFFQGNVVTFNRT